MLYYIIIGVVWAAWLEYYTTQNIFGPMGKPWVWRERIFHFVLWPLSLGTFVIEFLKGFFNL